MRDHRLVFCGCLGLVLLAGPAGAQRFGEVVEVNQVTVQVQVTDAAGDPFAGLRREDFRLFEDGKPVEITHFAVVGQAGAAATAASRGAVEGRAGAGVGVAEPAAATAAAGAPSEPPSFHLVVYVDNLHLRPAGRNRVMQQLRELLDSGWAQGARVMVISEDVGLTVRLPFSGDSSAIHEVLAGLERTAAGGHETESTRTSALTALVAIQRLNEKKGYPCARNIASPVTAYAESTRAEALRTIGRLRFSISGMAGLSGRKALLYVSDGLPVNPGEELYEVIQEICGGRAARSGERLEDMGVYDAMMLPPWAYSPQEVALDASRHSIADELRRLGGHANAHGVTLYTLQAVGLEPPASSEAKIGADARLLQLPRVSSVILQNAKETMVALAHETGGRAILDTNDARADLVGIRNELTSYYSLGFVADHHGDGKTHRLKVRVNRPGMRLAYPRSYRDKPALEQAADRTLGMLFHDFGDNPLEVRLEVGEATAAGGGLAAVPLRLHIPLFRLATLPGDSALEVRLRLFVVTSSPGGEIAPLRQVEVPLSIPREEALIAFGRYYLYEVRLLLEPGEHRVAVGVIDEVASLASFLGTTLRVGEPDGAAGAAPAALAGDG